MNEQELNEQELDRMRNDEPEKTAQSEEAPSCQPSYQPNYRDTPFSARCPEANERDAAPAQEAPAEPNYKDYFYASGPAHTAQSAQDNYESRGYTAPRYAESGNRGAQAQPCAAPAPAQSKQSGGFWKKAVALALACTLLSGAAGIGGAWWMNRHQKEDNTEPSPKAASTSVQVAAPRETKELNVLSVESGKLMTAAEVYKNCVTSTVGITTEITTNYWGFQSTGAAAGSGFILTEDGYILTNEHVIKDANSITVAMYDGTTYSANLIGYDANNDIAVLKIDASGLTPVTLGDSDALVVGDEVVAIGNPLGELTFSLTKGNVSALNRAVTLSNRVTMNLIQTDTAINSGNSGGALFNMYGEVVGITNAKYSSGGFSSSASIDNIGFAIPINSVRSIVSSIIEKGYISTPYIGISVANVSQESQDYGMPQGAAVRAVEEGGPAETAGLQTNDIVTAVNGEAINSYEELGKRISESQVGDELELTVYRKGETITITVTVGEKIQEAIPQSSTQSSSNGYSGGIPWYPDNP